MNQCDLIAIVCAGTALLYMFTCTEGLIRQKIEGVCVNTADIEGRSQNYTAPCNGIVSHGAPVGGI